MKHILILTSLLAALTLVGCVPGTDTDTQTAPDTQTPDESATSTETQGVTSNWRLNAYNPATDSTLSFLVVFENVQGGLAGNVYAYDAAASEPSESIGTVTGTVSSREQLDFRITFAESLGGGSWNVSARLNNSAFAGRYSASDGGGGSVTGSNLDGG